MLYKTKPWRHQALAYEWKRAHPAALLHMGMGTGKTKVTIDFVQNLPHERPLVLIACPLPVCKVWSAEIRKHAATKFHVWSAGDRRKKTNSAQKVRMIGDFINNALIDDNPGAIVVVLNYQLCITKPMMHFLTKQRWALVAADECQWLKNAKGKTSKFFYLLRKCAQHRVGLSGTPMPHNPLDIFGTFRFLDPTIFGMSWFQFKMHYGVWGGFENRKLLDIREKDDFARRIASITFTARSEDVLELPEHHHIERTFEMCPKGRKFYDTLEKDFVAWINQGDESEVTAAHALTRLLRLQQATSGHTQDDERQLHIVDTGKEELLEEVLDELDTSEPVVVFCRFKHDLDAVGRVTEKLRRRVAYLRGGLNQLDVWQRGDAEVLSCQIQTGREGVDFTRARVAIYYSLGFSLNDYEQSLKRLHRPGQERQVTYVHLLAENSVDQKVYTALRERRNAVEAVMREVAAIGGHA